MAHLCRDGQRKQRGRKRRGPRGARSSDADAEDDLATDAPGSKRAFLGSDDDGTTSHSDSEDDVDVVGEASSMDDDSTGILPRRPVSHDWSMEFSSDRSTLDSSSECGMDQTPLCDVEMMLSMAHTFDPMIARESLQSTFFDLTAPIQASSSCYYVPFAPELHAGYQLLDCTF